MEMLTAVLCDSAADYQGKLCILGAFDTIWARQFPATHAQCALALRFLFRDEDVGEHQLQIFFVDPDGHNLMPRGPISINLRIDAIPERAYFLSRNLVINLQGLPLREPAQYAFDLQWNGKLTARIPLQVVLSGPATGAPPPPPPAVAGA